MLIVLLHIFKCSIEFCLHTSSNTFPIISPCHILCHHSTHLWTTQFFLFFICFFSCWISCWCNSFNPHSFLFLPRPFPISVPLIHWQTDRHIYAPRVKPTEQFIRRNIETVHKLRSLRDRVTDRQQAPCLPPPRSIRSLSVRPSVYLSVHSQLPACQCLNWELTWATEHERAWTFLHSVYMINRNLYNECQS
jgi:hypothetical protein